MGVEGRHAVDRFGNPVDDEGLKVAGLIVRARDHAAVLDLFVELAADRVSELTFVAAVPLFSDFAGSALRKSAEPLRHIFKCVRRV